MTEHQINFREQLEGLQEELAIYATFPGVASANHVQTLALALIAASLATIAERSAPVSGPGVSDIEKKLSHLQNQIDLLFSVT